MVDFLLWLAGIIAAVLAWLLFMLNVASLPADVIDLYKELRK